MYVALYLKQSLGNLLLGVGLFSSLAQKQLQEEDSERTKEQTVYWISVLLYAGRAQMKSNMLIILPYRERVQSSEGHCEAVYNYASVKIFI